ncbi:uncharacterized protein EV422DRAFT_510905 [Fimicolochytrium jonesii]|uniref:uncharacterized protein n=1 Tax=Fimicolochytrium jonesii TaxID=1396493 RepID=UPI0022FF1CA1|nr:uncharacterized protein EV422DRAFT_510905 [Fimicolochytrium jonesii]KAI8826629.1 hypothetical protein EV422DRAFT_510905 [Fimicolochytrium jonesii]
MSAPFTTSILTLAASHNLHPSSASHQSSPATTPSTKPTPSQPDLLTLLDTLTHLQTAIHTESIDLAIRRIHHLPRNLREEEEGDETDALERVAIHLREVDEGMDVLRKVVVVDGEEEEDEDGRWIEVDRKAHGALAHLTETMIQYHHQPPGSSTPRVQQEYVEWVHRGGVEESVRDELRPGLAKLRKTYAGMVEELEAVRGRRRMDVC